MDNRTERDFSSLEQALMGRRSWLEERIGSLGRAESAESESFHSGFPHDRGEESSEEQFGENTQALLEHWSAELRDVAAALTRLHEGRYGICEVCGNDIPDGRLRAVPAVARCVTCEDG